MASSRPLPVEIVENIISFLCISYPSTTTEPLNGADQSFLTHSSIVQLLQLRLLARSWAAAIPQFVYGSLSLATPNFNRYVVNMWMNCLNVSNLTNLRRLCLSEVLYIPASKATGYHMALSDESSDQFEYEYSRWERNCIFILDAADIVSLCGSRLVHLKLVFARSVGFSDSMVVAIKRIRNLKTFSIEGTMIGGIVNDSKSLSAVLQNSPSLESLSLRLAALRRLNLDPDFLPNLRHLWIKCHRYNLDAYIPTGRPEQSRMLLMALRNTLEGLTVDTIPDDLPRRLGIEAFPKLRIVRCKYINTLRDHPVWFEWSLFHTIEVLIVNYCSSRAYWEDVLLTPGGPHLKEANKLKHFIFIIASDEPIEDHELTEVFKTYGIQCHFRSGITHTEVLCRQEKWQTIVRLLTWSKIFSIEAIPEVHNKNVRKNVELTSDEVRSTNYTFKVRRFKVEDY
ncbi:uncharacterized protein MELLADRAFT_87837 [Melampsora larici-populina 98AG31]|uniref:F-box domain-containing protein n=1 Tax=Melampsora larici-populina (strain 98AG31 / pathotype 3-4-7) TaxID=747676 RepID=F4RPN0_MELLP|nr:uncharacterized protein MELLADRAFT_87837 [Melampsora larici-populina 98AG31]EGG05566.1 hypothetical protein MELLADRAFT_87837 [Melampsora larici-populina 98AG31]